MRTQAGHMVEISENLYGMDAFKGQRLARAIKTDDDKTAKKSDKKKGEEQAGEG